MKRLNRKSLQSKVVLLLLIALTSCSFGEKTSSEIKNFFSMEDIEPPVLLEVQSVSNNQVRLVFNEEISPYLDSFSPNIVECEGYSVLVTLTQSVKAGSQIMLSGRVKDGGGNTTGFSTPVWGFNSDLPEMQINEFSTRGEGNNPDRTELLILSDGDMAGAALYCGIPDSWDIRVVFEPQEVKAGDYIVIWWTETLPEGKMDTAYVYNICARSSENLPGYNGVLTLTKSPAQGSEIMDCVIYSNNSLTYEGYGSKSVMERAQKAIANGWWSGDPVDSTNSTATRTFCKEIGSNNWYICVTKGATFGQANNSDIFTGN